jgi:hypothetical protein
MANNSSLSENPWERLANAIVLSAVSDYRAALRKLKRNPQNQDAMSDAMAIERFFRSGWFSILTSVDGEYLMDRLRKEAAEKK